MATQTRTGPFSFGDFLELVKEDQKADLLDGVIHMTSPESVDHNDLVFWLGMVLGQFVEEGRLGKLNINRVAYRLSDKNAPEPDLGFVSLDRLGIRKSGYVDGAPDVAVEFVSPDSVERDYVDKRRRYEEAGVQEYWIIDPDESRATFLRLESGKFVEVAVKDHVFRSRAVPAFYLDTRWLWQRPLPPSLAIVQEMLAKAAESSPTSKVKPAGEPRKV